MLYAIPLTRDMIFDIHYRSYISTASFVGGNFYTGDNDLSKLGMHVVKYGFNHITLAVI